MFGSGYFTSRVLLSSKMSFFRNAIASGMFVACSIMFVRHRLFMSAVQSDLLYGLEVLAYAITGTAPNDDNIIETTLGKKAEVKVSRNFVTAKCKDLDGIATKGK